MSTTLHLTPADESIVVRDTISEITSKLIAAKLTDAQVITVTLPSGRAGAVPTDRIVYAEARA